MSKKILFDAPLREKLLSGSEKLAHAVGTTLGPRGNNVGIDLGYATWIIHDGVSVAKAVELEDQAENFAVRVLRESANRTVQSVGDGTTVTTILAYEIFKEALTAISTGTNAMSLRRGLEDARDILINELSTIAIPVNTLAKKIQIATISAEDEALGKQVGTLIHKLGLDGVITVEEAKSPDTYIEQQDGMQFNQGFASPYFVTDLVRGEATVEDTFLLITDKSVVNVNELLPLFNDAMKDLPKNIVIIAPDITDSALGSFIVNKLRGSLNISCVKAPFQAQEQKDFLQDIAILTGGVVISSEQGTRFENTTVDMLGRAKRVTSTIDASMIVGGEGDPSAIKERIESIKALQDRFEGSDYQKEKLRERIAKLSQGIAVIKVGGATEIEMKERTERVKDAVAATHAAVAEGMVAGGETIYLRIREALGSKSLPNQIMYNALAKPFYLLLGNAGYEGARYLDKLEENQGVDVTDGSIQNMLKAGIIDPVMVPKEAIRNAVSVAIQLMQTQCLILEKPEEKTK